MHENLRRSRTSGSFTALCYLETALKHPRFFATKLEITAGRRAEWTQRMRGAWAKKVCLPIYYFFLSYFTTPILQPNPLGIDSKRRPCSTVALHFDAMTLPHQFPSKRHNKEGRPSSTPVSNEIDIRKRDGPASTCFRD